LHKRPETERPALFINAAAEEEFLPGPDDLGVTVGAGKNRRILLSQ